MYKITKEFAFEAAHQLKGLPENHPCMRMHGHSYRVQVVLESDTLDDVGFVYDYRRMDTFKKFIDDNLDHKFLNDVIPLSYSNTSAENIAHWLYEVAWRNLGEASRNPLPGLVHLVCVRVSETQKTWAEYTP